MHIKALVLDNFKSFGRKTRIPFYDDFTTVSGPNGSGKSNIIDAVLFALGLARTRGIRAEKLTDLIYNPGYDDGDRPAGSREASVEVILDNSEGVLKRAQVVNAAGTDSVGEVDEITVKRRVKETESNYYSYYYLNGRSVNLSDIQDLLAQAGITPEGYNVVMQGDVTEIIQMTAYQRRGIIDEIAGVAEFDEKKDRANEELDTVKERIAEAELRIEEKTDRLSSLEEEREVALEYKGLQDEKTTFEGYLKAAELKGLRADLDATRSSIENRESDRRELEDELDEKQAVVTDLEDDLAALNEEIRRKGEDEQLEIKAEIESIKGDIARLEGEIESAEERITEAEARRRNAFVDIDRKQERVEELEGDIRETKLEKASLASDIQELEAERESVQAEIDAVDTEFETLRDELTERKADLETEREAKHELQRKQDRLLDEARRRSTQLSDLQDDLETATSRLPELDAERQDVVDELEKATANVEQITTVVEDLKTEKQELQASLNDIEDEIQALQQEYAELEAKASENGDSSFPRSVSAILNADVDGVRGAVAQLGSVDDEYAVACETAAGSRLANVVVSDDGVGQRCIEYLKSRNAGRATFLPMTKMDSRSLPRLPNHPGVIDFAYNLVSFDDEFAGVFSYVLGGTVVVDAIDTAREFMGEYRMVTLDGDLVERSGAMTGGSTRGTRYSFSASEGQLERVANEIHSLNEERKSLRDDIQSIENRLENARDKQAAAQDECRSIENDLASIDERRDATEDELADLEDQLADLEAERDDVDDEMQELEDAIAAREDAIAEIEADIEDLEAELADSQIPALSSRIDEIREEIHERNDRMSDLDSRMNELGLEKQYAENAIEDLHDEIETAQNRKAEQEARIEDLEARIEEKAAILEEKHDAVAALETELTDLKSERDDLEAALREAKAARDDVRTSVVEMENRLESLRKSVARLEVEIKDLESGVDEYDPEDIPDHDDVVANIDRLERAMKKLEPVNMRAIDAYDEVNDALETLIERNDTLVEERNAIRERIESYEEQKKAAFMAAFEAINEHFVDIFERLSNGTGELLLENPTDPFEEGLTMKAQPGDKPIQRLNAMSGGEKSLTALAFIFAIQRYNPAPFYALDEIDAFLDAANAERVGEMVDELADTAQFVVVSHRSALLDRSDRAIGVTMQDGNVSTVTGIQFGEHESEEVTADD